MPSWFAILAVAVRGWVAKQNMKTIVRIAGDTLPVTFEAAEDGVAKGIKVAAMRLSCRTEK